MTVRAGAGLALVAIGAFAAMACGTSGSGAPQASPATTASQATPTPSRLELPRDDGGYWYATQLVPGRAQVLVGYTPFASSPEERAGRSSKLGTIDLKTGSIAIWRTLAPGDQVAAAVNDGKVAAWTEAGVMGVKETRWAVFVRDLGTGDTREVDRLPVDVRPPAIGYGTPLALDGGRLAYSRLAAGPDGIRDEVVLLELAGNRSTVVLTDPLANGRSINLSLSGNWLLRAVARPSGGTDLYRLDLSNPGTGPVRVLPGVPEAAVEGGQILVATADGRVLFGPIAGQLEVVDTSRPEPAAILTLRAGVAFWINESTHRAMMRRRQGTVSPLSDEDTLNVSYDGQLVSWVTAPTAAGGQRGDRFFLNWSDGIVP